MQLLKKEFTMNGAQALMQTLADEVEGVAPVRANSVNPGATRTGMRAQA